jgi:hypothetical protein
VADGIVFERLGVPAASIVTDAFTASGNAMARRMGIPGYRYTMLPHPVSNLTPDECKQRAVDILQEVLDILGVGERPAVDVATRQRGETEQTQWPAGRMV